MRPVRAHQTPLQQALTGAPELAGQGAVLEDSAMEFGTEIWDAGDS